MRRPGMIVGALAPAIGAAGGLMAVMAVTTPMFAPRAASADPARSSPVASSPVASRAGVAAARLQISIKPIERSGKPGGSARATLRCSPTGGNHPHAQKACADLTAASGDVTAVPPRPGAVCLAIWEPVEMSIRGVWHGRVIGYSETSSNFTCALISHGHVFALE